MTFLTLGFEVVSISRHLNILSLFSMNGTMTNDSHTDNIQQATLLVRHVSFAVRYTSDTLIESKAEQNGSGVIRFPFLGCLIIEKLKRCFVPL
jgi:hypothetical protein